MRTDPFVLFSVLASLLLMLGSSVLFRKMNEDRYIDYRSSLLGILANILGVFSLTSGFEILGTVPVNLRDPAFVLGLIAVIGGFGFVLLISASLILASTHRNLRPYSPEASKWVKLSTVCLITVLAIFPLLKVPKDTLVAKSGVLLQPGDSYDLIPGFKSQVVGLENPAAITIMREFEDKKISISIKLRIKLRPGDPVPKDLDWHRFEQQAYAWAEKKLPDRINTEPQYTDCDLSIAGFKVFEARCENRQRNYVSPQEDLISGIPILWNGDYEFRILN